MTIRLSQLFILPASYLIVCLCYATSIAKIKHPDLRINETVHIKAIAEINNLTVNDLKITELSDLAWDNDEEILYAISDKGHLFSFNPVFNNGNLNDLILLSATSLYDEQGKKLIYKNSDSEGLTLLNANNHTKGDTQYIISFERQPRVVQYNTNGLIEKHITIPTELSDISNYRSANKTLESVLLHEHYGLLIGVERSLIKEPESRLFLYTQDGHPMSFPAYFANGALTAMTAINDHSLLAVERSYSFFTGVRTALHRLDIENNRIKSTIVVRSSPAHKLFNHNFEGLEKHQDDHYFMINDDNNLPLNRTLLIYFSYRAQ